MKLQGKIFTKLFALLLSVLLTLVATTLVVTTLIGAIPSYAALAESDDPPTPPAVSPYSVSLSPAPITFPAADEGYGAQKAQTVTITNTGSVATGSLSIAFSEGAASAFKLSKSSQTSIAIGKTGSFTVVPNTKLSAGTYTAAVKVSNGNVPPETVEVSFTVNPLHYEISLKPDVINFPAVDEGYGAQKAQTVTITNTGNAATGSLSIALSGGAASAFKLSKSSQTSIAIGKTGSFTVVPNTKLSAGTYTAAVKVSNGNVPPETIEVSFTVNPLHYGISLKPDDISFSAVDEGYGAQKAQTVTITNTGNAATGSLSIALSGGAASAFKLSKSSQTSIAIGKTGSFTVAPNTKLSAGTYAATVTVSNGNVPQETVEVSFTVNPLHYGISLKPDVINFPAADAGYGAQKAQTVTITNTGNAATGSLSIAFSDGAASAFKLSKSSQTSIAIGKTGSFTVAPNTKLSAGTYSATITVSNGNVPQETVDVSFTVIPLRYEVSLNPDKITFPDVGVGYAAQKAQTVTITNTGNTATGALNISLGTGANLFTLSKSSQTSLAVGKTGTFTVTPKTGLGAGTHTASVTISNGAVPVKTVELSFFVEAIYSVSLTPDAIITFRTVKEGYVQQSPQTVTVKNTGNVPTGDLYIELSGANSDAFSLSADIIGSIAVGGSRMFTVKPNTGLDIGNYTAEVTVSNGDVQPKTVNASFTVIDRSLTPTYYVSAADGSDASGDGSAGKPWESVQFGVNKLAAGDMLIIREGVYKEKVSISVSGIEDDYIVIMGETGAILDGEGVSNSYNSEDWNSMITMNNVSYVRVENLEIRNFTPTSSSNAGILVEATKTGKSVGVQVVNNKIHDLNRTPGVPNAANKKHGHGIGVYGRGTAADGAVRELLIEGNEVYNCKLYQSETVVVNGNVSDWQIINNYIHDNDNIGIDAIGGEKTSSTTATDRARYGLIAGNVLVNNSSGAIGGNEGYKDKGIIDLCAGGIYVDGGRNIEIRDNYVERSDYGIEIAAENGTSYWPSGITVSNNVVVGCSQAGIGMGGDESVSKIGANDVLVEFNTIYCNKAAYGCIVRSGKNGPYTISKNIILVGNGTTYVWGSYGTAIYAGNVYFGGSSSIPSGDLTGQYVTTLPVASLVTSSPGWFEPVSGIDAGARLTPARTPFLDRVYD